MAENENDQTDIEKVSALVDAAQEDAAQEQEPAESPKPKRRRGKSKPASDEPTEITTYDPSPGVFKLPSGSVVENR